MAKKGLLNTYAKVEVTGYMSRKRFLNTYAWEEVTAILFGTYIEGYTFEMISYIWRIIGKYIDDMYLTVLKNRKGDGQ